MGEWSTDTYGHGTHVAGTISALNNSVGIDGISPNGLLNLHIVKVIHKANYWAYWGSDVIAAVQSCQTAGATVINMSLAGTSSSTAEQQALQSAYDSGILLVGAAGNRGNDSYYYPASYDSVISVGAVDQTSTAWDYTQTNDQIELVAPGVGVESTLPNNRYGLFDGTSAAAADLLASEGCDANVPNVITTETDSSVFTGSSDVEPVGDISTEIPADVVLNQGYAQGIGCSSTGGVTLQSSNRRFLLARGDLFFNFDVGVRRFGFNAYLKGGTGKITITTASGKTNVIDLTQDGYVGINSAEDIVAEDIVAVTFEGADGMELGDFSRSNSQNGVTAYSNADAFAAVGTTVAIDDIENATNKDQWFGQVDTAILSCVANGNVGIASTGSNDFSVAPTTASVITSNGDQDFTINFNFPPNLLSFNTHLNSYGPATLTVTTVDDVQTVYNIAHSSDIVGFFGLDSVQKIKSIRWVSTNGWLVKTGISNLRADVIAASATNTDFEGLSWALPASHPDQDTCGGARQANFDPNVYYVRSNTFEPKTNITTPDGYRWLTKTEYTALSNASTVSSKNDNVWLYYQHCGLSAYPKLSGRDQHIFLFKNGGTTGVHAGHYERNITTNVGVASNLAGYVLYKDN